MDLEALFKDHIQRVSRGAEKALVASREAGSAFDGIVLHAGTQFLYHADDHPVHFKTVPHFARFAPVHGPDHLLLFRPGKRPRLAQVVPRDYWYEPPSEPEHPYAQVLDVVHVATAEEARAQLGDVSRCAYVGNDPAVAQALGMPAAASEPAALLAGLDWDRGFKTPYEVECIREAGRIAARGHLAVRTGVAERRTERQMEFDYLQATGMLALDVPYTDIIAWDECSAVLHYQSKRSSRPTPGGTLLIDAGAVHHGYASDITRTYVQNGVHPLFKKALDRMEELQLRLVAAVGPGQSYVELHEDAHLGIGEILREIGVLTVDGDVAFERGLTRPFFPHGLGHHLGIQVHDVGGRQVTAAGERLDPPAQYPFLRTTRELAEGHVVTIEPGLYFIPMLLEPFRSGRDAKAFDWKIVDELVPCGGIRIEDDILVTASGRENLTRPFVPGNHTK